MKKQQHFWEAFSRDGEQKGAIGANCSVAQNREALQYGSKSGDFAHGVIKKKYNV